MIKLLDILNESYNPNIYQVECRVVMGTGNGAIPEIISDIRAIPGVTTVDTISSDYNTEEGRHAIDLSIKVDPSPFNPFDKSSFEKILNDIKKLPDVRGAKFTSSPIIAENITFVKKKLIKEEVDNIKDILKKGNKINKAFSQHLDKYINHYKKTGNVSKNKLQKLVREVLQEKKEDRCKRIADRRYDKPSAYKSGAIVRCRQGKIWKNLK